MSGVTGSQHTHRHARAALGSALWVGDRTVNPSNVSTPSATIATLPRHSPLEIEQHLVAACTHLGICRRVPRGVVDQQLVLREDAIGQGGQHAEVLVAAAAQRPGKVGRDRKAGCWGCLGASAPSAGVQDPMQGSHCRSAAYTCWPPAAGRCVRSMRLQAGHPWPASRSPEEVGVFPRLVGHNQAAIRQHNTVLQHIIHTQACSAREGTGQRRAGWLNTPALPCTPAHARPGPAQGGTCVAVDVGNGNAGPIGAHLPQCSLWSSTTSNQQVACAPLLLVILPQPPPRLNPEMPAGKHTRGAPQQVRRGFGPSYWRQRKDRKLSREAGQRKGSRRTSCHSPTVGQSPVRAA